jgi:hypothetical protein
VKSWLVRTWRWAGEKPYFWANVLLALGTVALTSVWSGPVIQGAPSDTRLRVWAVTLQLIGIWTVWRDLTSTAHDFGRDSILSSLSAWLRRGWSTPARTASMAGSAIGQSTVRGRAKSRWTVDATQPLEVRVQRLEANVNLIDQSLDAAFADIDRRGDEIESKVGDERIQRETADAALETRLKHTAVGNFSVLAFGAGWLVVGTVLGGLAPEIVRLSNHDWVAVLHSL